MLSYYEWLEETGGEDNEDTYYEYLYYRYRMLSESEENHT